jgi:DNA topoisomerase-1
MCRGYLAWRKLEESVQKRREAMMADHKKAHPPVLLTMIDGQPVSMITAVDDIILKAEAAVLLCVAEEAVVE